MEDRFHVTRSSAYQVYKRVSKAIAVNLVQRFIEFCSGQKAREENYKHAETRFLSTGVMGVSMTAL